jgi:hypothetical protein
MNTSAKVQVDEFMNALPEWQKTLCVKVRALIHEAVPDIEERIKRTNRPYFVYKGNICALQSTKDHINLLIYDPIAPDPYNIINQGHNNKTARAIQIYENQVLNESAFKDLVKEIASNNNLGGWRKLVK